MKKRSSPHQGTYLRFLGYSLAVLCIVSYGSLFAFRIDLSSLLAAATSSISGAPAVLYFTPYLAGDTISVGDSADLDLNINAKVPINALGVTITYPKDLIELVAIDKKKSFLDLWTEDTVIKEGSGELHFSGGTTKSGGLIGTSTVLTISVRAKRDGEAKLSVEDLQVLAADGKGTLLETDTRTISYSIVPRATSPAVPAVSSGGQTIAAPPQVLSADFNGDGKVSLIDMSILIIKMMSPYDARYDLNMDGQVGLSDLSVLFSRMGAAQ